MKLVLKQVAPDMEVTTLDDDSRRYVPGKVSKLSPFALHADTGEVLPCQVTTSMKSERGQLVQLTVVFTVDGDNLRVEGHGL